MRESTPNGRATRRRALGGGATLAAAGVLPAACGGAGTGQTDAGGTGALSTGPVTITPFISAITDPMMNDWQEQIAKPYQQQRANAKVELVPAIGPTIDRIQKINAMIAAGSPPDLSEGPQHVTVMNPLGLLDPALDA